MKLTYVMLLLIIPVAYSLEIGLSVNTILSADVLYFSFNDTTAVKSFTTEIFNSGSLSYDVQVRVDVFNDNGSVFTGWSDTKRLIPGNNGYFVIYWVAESGDYTARLRVYHGGEITERYLNISATKMGAVDAYNITSVKVFNKYIEYSVSGAGDIVIIPVNYPQSWVLPQRPGMLMPYNAPGLENNRLDVYVVSKDGKYVSKNQVELKRATGPEALVRNFLYGLM